MNDAVLTFSHVYSSAPWGGKMMRTFYDRTDVPSVTSESWEISGHAFGMSVVAAGPHAGKTLDALTKELGVKLIGTKGMAALGGLNAPLKFPLLFKLVDARWPLSIQVHPNDVNASLTGGDPKSEAWYVIKAFPHAALYAGLKHHFNESDLREIVAQGPILLDQLRPYEVEAGDLMYVPGGLPHAIGGGCFIYEVQQASDTTYRFYDWGRSGDNGKPRPLHIEESFKSLDYSLPPPEIVKGGILETPYFSLREVALDFPIILSPNGSTFIAGFVLDGETDVASRGESFLIPAAADPVTVTPLKPGTRLILTTLS